MELKIKYISLIILILSIVYFLILVNKYRKEETKLDKKDNIMSDIRMLTIIISICILFNVYIWNNDGDFMNQSYDSLLNQFKMDKKIKYLKNKK